MSDLNIIFKDLDLEICKVASNIVKNDIFRHCALEENLGKFHVLAYPNFHCSKLPQCFFVE